VALQKRKIEDLFRYSHEGYFMAVIFISSAPVLHLVAVISMYPIKMRGI